jgi:hypothetical protein
MRIDPDTCRDPDLLAAEVRRLQAVIDAMPQTAEAPPEPAFSGAGKSGETGNAPEPAIPPAWLARPYYVDPPEGWRWGFPRLYDPATDGDMRAWMVANGYPQRLADQGLPCTFTACTETGET